MDIYPPPHSVFYETLNDVTTTHFVRQYKQAHEATCEVDEIDAAQQNSMDDFAKWFIQWIAFAPARPTTTIRLLVIWHAHFLSLSCQQMLRRSMERRSFRCRIWFHIEEPTLQAAILSRCVVRNMPSYEHIPRVVGYLQDAIWTDPKGYETNHILSTKDRA